MALLERHGPGGIELFALDDGTERLVVGKNDECDLVIDGDAAVSRVHAKLERVGPAWSITDLGSTNGTVVNGERVLVTRMLRHRDELLLGRTRLVYRDKPGRGPTTERVQRAPRLTRTEREVLVELCRPALSGNAFKPPTSVHDIATARFVSEGAVKQTLDRLYDKFDIEGPERRIRLANEALLRGAITLADLTGEVGEG